MEQAIGGFVIVLAVFIILFLIFRRVTLWYFRINDVIKNLEMILAEIKKSK